MENIAHRAIVQNHHFAQIWLDRAEVFDVRPVAQRAVLPVVTALKVLALLLEPVDHRVGVLLDTSREDDEFIPLADLAQEFVAVWTLVNIVQNGMLRSQYGLRPAGCQGRCHGHGKFDFNHVATGHAAALGKRVNECLIEIQHQGLLRKLGGARRSCI